MSSYLCTKTKDSIENLPSNGFFQFLNSYRREQSPANTPAWVTAVNAGSAWTQLSENEKLPFKKQSKHSTCYPYKPRDRHLNRVLQYLEKGLDPEHSSKNVIYVAKAVQEMQIWKRKTYKELLDSTTERPKKKVKRAGRRKKTAD